MSNLFERWRSRLKEFQTSRQKGLSISPWNELEALIAEIDALAFGGLEFANAAKELAKLEEATLFSEERKYDESYTVLASIDVDGVFPKSVREFLKAGIYLVKGNILLVRDINPAAASEYFQKAIDAGDDNEPLMRGNGACSLGTCLQLLDRHEESITSFNLASRNYVLAGMPEKRPVIQHALGNVYKRLGNVDSAITLLARAIEMFKAQCDPMGIWRAADDLTRAYLDKSEQDFENSISWVKKAREMASLADCAIGKIWSGLRSETDRLTDLTDQLLNHVATLVDLSVVEDCDIHGLGALAIYKGRIRTGQASIDQSILNKLPADIVEGLTIGDPVAYFEAIRQTLAQLPDDQLPIAYLDQFAIEGGNLVSFFCIVSSGAPIIGRVVSPPFQALNEPAQPDLRGRQRVGAIAGEVKKLMETLNVHSGRCQAVVSQDHSNLPEDSLWQIRQWSEEIASNLSRLGDWFFPKSLLDRFRSNKVRHVVHVIDPAFAQVPYLSLHTETGQIVDEPWNLSLLTAPTEILRFTSRLMKRENAVLPIQLFAPDTEVNSNRGGDAESLNLRVLAQVDQFNESLATLNAVQNGLQTGAWIHFRGHGRWTGEIETSGPVMSGGEVLSTPNYPTQSADAGVLFTAACGTAFGEAVGAEFFGSLVDYDRAGLLAAILTLWPIDGEAATVWTKYFYENLRESGDAAAAMKYASRSVREELPHPFYWAPFSLVGAWKIGQLIAWH